MSTDTQSSATTPREEAFAEAAEALQTLATGTMALFSAMYNLIEDVSKKPTATDAAENKADAAPQTTPPPKAEPAPTAQSDPTPKPTITPDDITKACVVLIKHDRANSQRIQALLQTYGVSQMSALDPSKYEAFLKDLEALES